MSDASTANNESSPSPKSTQHRASIDWNPARVDAELQRDHLLRIAMGLAVGLGVFMLIAVLPASGSIAPQSGWLLALLVVFGAWIARAVADTKAAGAARGLLIAAELSPEQVEQRLAQWLERRGMVGWVRLMLYHAAATLRHRQGRHAEAAALCGRVLASPLGPGESARPQVLLLLAESALQAGQWWSAYAALQQLHALPLTLNQLLQRLGLQVRYEVSLGYDQWALHRWHTKTQLAELMPGPLCGLTHAMLGLAAHRTEQPETARWMNRRAGLLCTPEQLDQLREQGLAVPTLNTLA